MALICFATGNIWRWKSNNNKRIDLLRKSKLDIDGIELTVGYKNLLYKLKLSPENKRWLRGLKYVSIHAPFGLVHNSRNYQEFYKQMELLKKIYLSINAKALVIHPMDLPKPEIMRKYPFKALTENMEPCKKVSHKILRRLFTKAPKVNMCLDVAHAYLKSKSEAKKLVSKFRNKIKQVHFSCTYKHKDHQSLRKATKSFIRSVQVVKKLNVPVIIEEDMRTKKIAYIIKEISLVRKIING